MIHKDFKVDSLCYICAYHTIPITTSFKRFNKDSLNVSACMLGYVTIEL